MTHRLFVIVLAAISLLGFFIRFLMSIDPSIWADEGQHVWIVGVNHWYEMRQVYETTAHDQPFGLYVVLYIWKNLFGWSQVAMRCFSVFFSSASIPLLAAYTYNLVNRKSISIVSALLLCLSPVSIRYGYDVTPYALVQFLAVISTGQFLNAIKAKKYGFTMLHVLTNMCLLNTHYFSYFFIGSQTLVFAVYLFKADWKTISNRLIYPCLFYVFATLPMILLFNPIIAKGNHWWIGLENKSSLEVLSNLVSYENLFAWTIIFIFLGLLIKKQFFEKNRTQQQSLYLVYPIISMVIIMVFSVYIIGVFMWKVSGSERYYISLLPGIVLAISFILLELKEKVLRYSVLSILVLLFIYDGYKNLPKQNYQDFDTALSFIKKDTTEDSYESAVIFVPECCRWGINYYKAQKNISEKTVVIGLADFINDQVQSQNMMSKIKQSGNNKIYTLLYYESLKHKQKVMDRMAQYARLMDIKNFHGVSVLVHSIE